MRPPSLPSRTPPIVRTLLLLFSVRNDYPLPPFQPERKMRLPLLAPTLEKKNFFLQNIVPLLFRPLPFLSSFGKRLPGSRPLFFPLSLHCERLSGFPFDSFEAATAILCRPARLTFFPPFWSDEIRLSFFFALLSL